MDHYLKTATHLKKIISIALSDLLGTYTLPNGQKMEAIAINPSMANLQFPPAGTSIEGLECHIYYPEVKSKSAIGGLHWNLIWLVYLKQWDIRKTTLGAAEKFAAHCPYEISNVFRNSPNTNVNQPEVCRFQIYCRSIICR